ncbi:type II toxin-antitoxin system RelE/ParE family toxin [Rhizobium sp. CFBP 13726]|uniref:type II toxin-antitoxin system RelE/ParE family toxin n=2 Tax=unclassified Rhizobium TaxID=2613769 RepID=UPI0010DCAD1D|nr:type II toxin-antitoxin system RelE/ParE family toxin [Rhizobium sp. CFBP 13726]MBD8649811.1 type II toxin-antitoxin system RelE/ParE family toxin [Rhizobium sp. CFBP 13726]RYG82280.1 MAG: type II toxin-antitoxin system RelE/ParE family toxin [Alphaproteobacteria bacterium]
MKVTLSEEAIRYVQRERAYLAQFGRRTAVAFSDQIKRTIRLISEQPRVGTMVAPVEGIRRFVATPYHFDYVIQSDRVLVVSVMHARQASSALDHDDDDGFD